MTLLEIFESELATHGIKWCKGCDSHRGHKRGFVFRDDRTTVHYDSKISTRKTLLGGLHEIGHCVTPQKGRTFQREQEANRWAFKRMCELGIPIPRDVRAMYGDYVARKKRHGDNVRRAARRRG